MGVVGWGWGVGVETFALQGRGWWRLVAPTKEAIDAGVGQGLVCTFDFVIGVVVRADRP